MIHKILYMPAGIYLKHIDNIDPLEYHDYSGSIFETQVVIAAILREKDYLGGYPAWLKINEITLPFLEEHIQIVEVKDEDHQ